MPVHADRQTVSVFLITMIKDIKALRPISVSRYGNVSLPNSCGSQCFRCDVDWWLQRLQPPCIHIVLPLQIWLSCLKTPLVTKIHNTAQKCKKKKKTT